jgi:putative PIN family toxin of toxin-antitoxin system
MTLEFNWSFCARSCSPHGKAGDVFVQQGVQRTSPIFDAPSRVSLHMPSPLSPPAAQSVVLDTNIVLDWLVFENAACTTLATCILSGEWRWLATQAMADELGAVLAYPALARWSPDPDKVWRHWSTWTQIVEPAAPCALHCKDGDDQKFIDLALAHRARWLFSRDRALLALAKKASAWGVTVQAPARPPRHTA